MSARNRPELTIWRCDACDDPDGSTAARQPFRDFGRFRVGTVDSAGDPTVGPIRTLRTLPLAGISDNLIHMPDISATEAARHFSDVLDSVEHEGSHYTIVRHGKAVAHLEPVSRGLGSEVKAMLLKHGADKSWVRELAELRDVIEIDDRP